MGNFGSSERRKSLHILTLEKRQQPIITRPFPLLSPSLPPPFPPPSPPPSPPPPPPFPLLSPSFPPPFPLLSPSFPPPFPLHTSSRPPLPGNVVAPTIECALGCPDDVGRSCFGFDTWPCGHSFYPVRPSTAKNRLFCRKML